MDKNPGQWCISPWDWLNRSMDRSIGPWDLLTRSMDRSIGPWKDKAYCMYMLGHLIHVYKEVMMGDLFPTWPHYNNTNRLFSLTLYSVKAWTSHKLDDNVPACCEICWHWRAGRSQSDCRESWLLYFGMVPTVLDDSRTDTLPRLLCHHHCL